jgi:hypothetical protein
METKEIDSVTDEKKAPLQRENLGIYREAMEQWNL